MSEWLKSNQNKLWTLLGSVGALLPLLSLAFSAYQFVRIEDEKLRQQSFENYHSLISKLGTQTTSSTVASATIYEMKNYPAYCEISLLIIDFYQEPWKGDKLDAGAMELVKPDLQRACKR